MWSRGAAALEGVEWSAARPGRTLPPGKTRYPLYRRAGLDGRKISSPPGFDRVLCSSVFTSGASPLNIQWEISLRVIYKLSWVGGSVVGIATGNGPEGPAMESQYGRSSAAVLTGRGAHPAYCTMGTGALPGVRRRGQGVDNPPAI